MYAGLSATTYNTITFWSFVAVTLLALTVVQLLFQCVFPDEVDPPSSCCNMGPGQCCSNFMTVLWFMSAVLSLGVRAGRPHVSH